MISASFLPDQFRQDDAFKTGKDQRISKKFGVRILQRIIIDLSFLSISNQQVRIVVIGCQVTACNPFFNRSEEVRFVISADVPP